MLHLWPKTKGKHIFFNTYDRFPSGLFDFLAGFPRLPTFACVDVTCVDFSCVGVGTWGLGGPAGASVGATKEGICGGMGGCQLLDPGFA